MRAVKLVVEPFEFINYMELDCTRNVNQHGMLRIRGLIRQEKEQDYMGLAAKECWVNVKAVSESGEERSFFYGILTELWIERDGGARILTIELKTGSFLLDIEAHTRSFQDDGFSYRDVISACLEPADGKYIMLDKKEERTGRFLFQFQETDWAFMRRLASYMGTVLIPEDAAPGKKIYFGCRDKDTAGEMDQDHYRLEQGYEEYRKRKAMDEGAVLQDFAGYHVQTREIYRLGEKIDFQGRSYIIGGMTSWLSGQELYNEYHLISKKRGSLPVFYNWDIAGISLKAEVTAVRNTMVQVSIGEDENKRNCKSRWFHYSTVYSTPDGAGWYCMPETGDTVQLVFPDEKEGNAYIASSVHIGTAGGRTNPDQKSWKNRQGKEILFTPDSIVLRNNKGMSVELSDREGIRLSSDKNIVVQADGDVSIVSQGGGVDMSAPDNILIRQGAAKIQMSDTIKISGGKVYMN